MVRMALAFAEAFCIVIQKPAIACANKVTIVCKECTENKYLDREVSGKISAVALSV